MTNAEKVDEDDEDDENQIEKNETNIKGSKGNLDHNFIEIKIKIAELESKLISLKEQLDHNIRGTIQDEEDEKNKDVASGNLRDYIKNVYMNVKNLTERVRYFLLR